MAHRPGDSRAPSSRPPEDRKTPVAADEDEYAAYVNANGRPTVRPAVHGRSTQRIGPGDLERLVDETRRTGTLKRPPLIDLADPGPEPRAPGLPRYWLVGLGGVALLAGVVFLLSPLRGHSEAAGAAPPAPSASGASAASDVALHESATSAPSAAAAPSPAEKQAREALGRLRDGLVDCIEHGIHTLPGSSPPVPATFGLLKAGGYTSAPAAWRRAVWSCGHFQMQDPMLFQLQWQLVRPGAEGAGVAWIDTDGDGTPDCSLSFSIKIGDKGRPVPGDVGACEAPRPVLTVR